MKTVLTWFEAVENKEISTFIQFNINDFYPSISKDLPLKSIEYANSFIPISNEDIEITVDSKTFILLSHGLKRTAKTYLILQWVAMIVLGCVKYSHKRYDKSQIGHYRDDGHVAFQNVNKQCQKKNKKQMVINKRSTTLNGKMLCFSLAEWSETERKKREALSLCQSKSLPFWSLGSSCLLHISFCALWEKFPFSFLVGKFGLSHPPTLWALQKAKVSSW